MNSNPLSATSDLDDDPLAETAVYRREDLALSQRITLPAPAPHRVTIGDFVLAIGIAALAFVGGFLLFGGFS